MGVNVMPWFMTLGDNSPQIEAEDFYWHRIG